MIRVSETPDFIALGRFGIHYPAGTGGVVQTKSMPELVSDQVLDKEGQRVFHIHEQFPLTLRIPIRWAVPSNLLEISRVRVEMNRCAAPGFSLLSGAFSLKTRIDSPE